MLALGKQDVGDAIFTPAEHPNKTRCVKDSADSAEIQDALLSISSLTAHCITFKSVEDEIDYIVFLPGERCQSGVGKQGGQQNITLAQACVFRGAIQHLVLHALGLFHEHHRGDRDNYLRIYLNRTNLPPDSLVFHKFPQMPSYGTEYDLESILHYGAFDLTDPTHPNLPVFLPKTAPSKGKRIKMGQRRTLSSKDIVKLYTAYNCTNLSNRARTAEPALHFVTSFVSTDMCATLSKLKCGEDTVTESCTGLKVIKLSCNSGTTSQDWEDAAATVARLPLRPVSLHLQDRLPRYEAPIAFRPIRRLISNFIISWCKDSRCTSALSIFGLVNLLGVTIAFSSDLVIKKADFNGLYRLQCVSFRRTTVLTLEPGTFSNLPELKLLTMEREILLDTPQQAVDVDERGEYVWRLHCDCAFSHFRTWRKNNKALRLEVEAGELGSIEGVTSYGAFTKDDVFYPVDCRATATANFTINLGQWEYSINEPLCETGNTSSGQHGPSVSFPRENMEKSTDPQSKSGTLRSQAVDKNQPNVTDPSRAAGTPSNNWTNSNETTSELHQSPQSHNWIYGCIGGVAALCILLSVYAVWRRLHGRPRHAENALSADDGSLLPGSVTTVQSAHVSISSIELTDQYRADADDLSHVDPAVSSTIPLLGGDMDDADTQKSL
ncbi:uncharacterized protein LOC129597397 [Paramacrobiotus metropolitanus]|uniref:uncharacterized protein LOC129597397 n=1 Tax=Paramacrobiotus metropolitanus TaxID=2943436 RepID=UPI0024461DCF|nr:uncharacterized protein LOC129597397 [Paramacrobiotus metropolitanus]